VSLHDFRNFKAQVLLISSFCAQIKDLPLIVKSLFLDQLIVLKVARFKVLTYLLIETL